jgi:hypothetical protein
MRLVGLSDDPMDPEDHPNNHTYRMDLRRFVSRRRVVSRVTFVPFVTPVLGQHPGRDVPFYFDPNERLIALKYEFEGSTAPMFKIFDQKKLLSFDQNVWDQYPTFSLKGDGFVFNGRRLMWFQRVDGWMKLHSLDFNHNSRLLGTIPGPRRHPVDQTWAINITSPPQGLPGAVYAYSTLILTNGSRAIFTEDCLVFIGVRLPQPLDSIRYTDLEASHN